MLSFEADCFALDEDRPESWLAGLGFDEMDKKGRVTKTHKNVTAVEKKLGPNFVCDSF